jgi:hypothetical protein
MQTLHGLIDHVMLTCGDERLIFEGKTYALPEPFSHGINWLMIARQVEAPVIIEVNDSNTVCAASMVVERHIISFTLPLGHRSPTICPPADGCPCCQRPSA